MRKTPHGFEQRETLQVHDETFLPGIETSGLQNHIQDN